jgi:hypothetical protein
MARRPLMRHSRSRSRKTHEPAASDTAASAPDGGNCAVLAWLQALLAERSWRADKLFKSIRMASGGANISASIAAVVTLADGAKLDDDEAAYLIGLFAEEIIDWAYDHDPELIAISQKIEKVERAHGLDEDEAWAADGGPPEWQALQKDWECRSDRLQADAMRRAGAQRFAALLEGSPATFEESSAVGCGTFWARWPEREQPS